MISKPFRWFAILATLLAACSEERALDATPPAPVADLAVTYDTLSASALLTWTAPGDDRVPTTVERYDIRYANGLPFDWALSRRGDAPPSPSPPGRLETYTIPSPGRGRDLYAAIRSVDVAGNASDISAPVQIHIPGITLAARCVAAPNEQPIPALDVTVTSAQVYALSTDASGSVGIADLATGQATIEVRSGQSATTWHTIRQAFLAQDDVALLYEMVEYRPATSAAFDSIFRVLLAASRDIGGDGILRRWRSLPVDVYIPEFTNTLGLDYRARTVDAINRWESRSGVDLFNLVLTLPAVGIEFQFLSPSQMGIQNGITSFVNDPQGFPERNIVKIVDSMGDDVTLYRIILHELGHTISFKHLQAGFIMFGAQPLPADITDDEALAVGIHSALPNGVDITLYDASPPTR